jgi:ribosomal protein S18 acetylase RimI-like enzyme
MKSYLLWGEVDIQLILDFIHQLARKSTIVDLEESLQLASVRATTRLWLSKKKLVGFAFVDDFNNLRFEIDTQYRSAQLDKEIIAWGVSCLKKRNVDTGTDNSLDASFSRDNTWQIALLEKFGFVRADLRTLYYQRLLSKPIMAPVFPPGFSLRCVNGSDELKKLVNLHRAAFGTDKMTVAQRLAIMQAPQYDPQLDLVAEAPNGELAAFCICGLDDTSGSEITGFTDPLGTHPQYQKRGLGKAIVTAGLDRLRKRGAAIVGLSTSSKNLAMQRLAEALDFTCVSEKLWFSKKV